MKTVREAARRIDILLEFIVLAIKASIGSHRSLELLRVVNNVLRNLTKIISSKKAMIRSISKQLAYQ